MQKSNNEISDIVNVIKEISEKTRVINDIVFQTKLLSFNASVEAARAGEHGKGFAVVAEEVGNLASMSGGAANEITDMLTKSVKKVTEIVDGTKSLMDSLLKQSKQKVDAGTSTAKDCALALDEILVGISSVNEMVREISNASHEQSAGVREINKAMSELDQVTQGNSSVAQESSQTASGLKSQAERLSHLVFDLTKLVHGDGSLHEEDESSVVKSDQSQIEKNVISIDRAKKGKPSPHSLFASNSSHSHSHTHSQKSDKRVVGLDIKAPNENDPRFEDV